MHNRGVTDRTQVLRLCDQLLAIQPSPVAALHRAVALAEVAGPEAALAAVESLEVSRSHLVPAVRADLLRRLGRRGEAAKTDGVAIACAANVVGRAHLVARRHTADGPTRGSGIRGRPAVSDGAHPPAPRVVCGGGGGMELRPPFWHGPYRIAAAEAADLAPIARLEAMVFPEPMALAALEHLYRQPTTHVLVARRDGLLGAYFAFEVQGPTGWVLANATDPAHRRQGLATVLVRTGEAVARRAGARWMVGTVRCSNEVQMRVLATLGWRTVGLCTRFFGNGEDAWVVWRLLPETPDDGSVSGPETP